MKRLPISVLVGAIAISGCDALVGRYAATGTEDTISTSHVATFSIVKGQEIKNVSVFGDKKNFLYLMIVCPGVQAAQSQGEGEGIEGDLMSDALIYYEWETTTGKARVSLSWNTKSDTVNIGKQRFNREKGNVFLIVRSPSGALNARQCGSLSDHADAREGIKHIREMFPSDELVHSVKFYGIDE